MSASNTKKEVKMISSLPSFSSSLSTAATAKTSLENIKINQQEGRKEKKIPKEPISADAKKLAGTTILVISSI